MNEAMSGSLGGTSEPTLASAISRLEDMRVQARELLGGCEIARDNLLGSAPTPGTDPNKAPQPSSAIHRLHDLISLISEYQADAQRNVRSIQNALGCDMPNKPCAPALQRIR